MKRSSCWIGVVLLSVFIGASPKLEADPVLDPANGHFYELVLTPDLTWHQAVDAAASMSWSGAPGYLAAITTSAEQAFVTASLGGGGTIDICWVGGYQDRSDPTFSEPWGGWKWITGEAWIGSGAEAPFFSFNNTFYDGSPEDYLVTWWGSGGLNDFSEAGSYDSRGFIVEYDPAPIPEASSILLLASGMIGGLRWVGRRSRDPVR